MAEEMKSPSSAAGVDRFPTSAEDAKDADVRAGGMGQRAPSTGNEVGSTHHSFVHGDSYFLVQHPSLAPLCACTS